MDDDLNVPQAIASLFSLRAVVKEFGIGRRFAEEAMGFLRMANDAIGVLQLEERSLDERMKDLIAARAAARAKKDWAAADKIRDEIAALGVVLQDTPQGVVWRRRE